MAISLEVLRNAVEADPDDPMMQFALGQRIYDEDDSPAGLAEAAVHFRRAWEGSPGSAVYGYKLGLVLAELGEDQEAATVLEGALERAGGLSEGEGHDLIPAIREALEALAKS